MNMPRNHHYIPQFWLKRFSRDGKSKLVWSYDWDTDKVDERSVATLMAEYDLYTQQAAVGPDVSLETGEMGKVDTRGAQLFQRLDGGDRSPALREELADFFAVMALSHPTTVNRYPSAAAGLLLNIQEAMEVANSPDDVIDYIKRKGLPDFTITSIEFAHLKSATPQARDLMFGQLFDSLLALGGNPDVPFSDVIVDTSGRATLKDRLLDMKWVLRKAKEPELVIGDTGIVFERGESDLGWKVVLGPDLVILITKSERPISSMIDDGTLESWEVDNINVETAARSNRLLVGGSKSAVETVAQHIRGR
jgi:hypothetical protein